MNSIFTTILCLLLSIVTLAAQSKRALVIGIGDYPSSSGWAKINGDSDIEIVRKTLLHLDYQTENIRELVNREATKRGIISQLKALAAQSSAGDIIYIHFSGHGQRVTDLDGDEVNSKYDESIVPYDAQKRYEKGVYEGENHIIDDEFNVYLTDISNKIGTSGQLYVVLDACHSGDSTRREDMEIPSRGIFDNFEIPESPSAVVRREQSPMSWVEVSACKHYQSNYECRVGDSHYGSLSYALYAIVTQSKSDNYNITAEVLQDKICTLHSPHNIPQTPVITTTNEVATLQLF